MSLPQSEFLTPAASGFWSNKPMMAPATFAMEMIGPQTHAANETLPKQSKYDNWHYRVAKPFPDVKDSAQYQPAHQFYTCSASTKSYSYQNDTDIKNAPTDDSIGMDQCNYPPRNDFKLQRPSSFHTAMQTEFFPGPYPIYASIPFYETETRTLNHVLVPCPVLPNMKTQYMDNPPKYSTDAKKTDLKSSNTYYVRDTNVTHFKDMAVDVNDYTYPSPVQNQGKPMENSNISYENFNEINAKLNEKFIVPKKSAIDDLCDKNLYEISASYGNIVNLEKTRSGESTLDENNRLHVSYSTKT